VESMAIGGLGKRYKLPQWGQWQLGGLGKRYKLPQWGPWYFLCMTSSKLASGDDFVVIFMRRFLVSTAHVVHEAVADSIAFLIICSITRNICRPDADVICGRPSIVMHVQQHLLMLNFS